MQRSFLRVLQVLIVVASYLLAPGAAQAKPKGKVWEQEKLVKHDVHYAPVMLRDKEAGYLTSNREAGGGHGLITAFPSGPDYIGKKDWHRVLDPVYEEIVGVNNRLFVRIGSSTAPLTEILLNREEVRDKRYGGMKVIVPLYTVAGQVPTPFSEVYKVGSLLVGVSNSRKRARLKPHSDQVDKEVTVSRVEIQDANRRVLATLDNVAGKVQLLKKELLRIDFVDEAGASVSLLSDLQLKPLAPPLPNLTVFTGFNGEPPEVYLALPLDAEGKLWQPLRADATAPLETLPVRGYRALGTDLHSSWIKEYETPDGIVLGWVSPDLSEETGPLWKTLTLKRVGFNATSGRYMPYDIYIGQLLDGTFMSYDRQYVPMANGLKSVYVPHLDKSQPSEQELIAALAPIFAVRGEDILAKRAAKHAEYQNYQRDLARFYGCTESDDPHSDICKKHQKYKEAVAKEYWKTAHELASELGGDTFIEWLLLAAERRVYTLEPERLRQLAASAKNPTLAAKATTRYQAAVKEREAARQEALKTVAVPAQNVTSSVTLSQRDINSWVNSITQMPAGLSGREKAANFLRDYRTWLNGGSSYKPQSPN